MRNSIDYQLIGKRIKHYRKLANMTQENLAELLNYTPGYISQIERGLTRPNLDTIAMICNELNCDVSTLLSTTNVSSKYMVPELQGLLQELSQKERKTLFSLITTYIHQRG